MTNLVRWACRLLAFWLPRGGKSDLYSDMSGTCPHQYYPNSQSWLNISETGRVYNEIPANHSQMYYFENYDYLGSDRKMIFRLEPCQGVVYLYIRKVRPCWPNPWTGEWTHYKSNTNGSDDGDTTLLELPAEATQWYITVFGKTAGKYSLSVVTDTSTYPRVGDGKIEASQVNENTVEIAWTAATAGVSSYIVYSSMYFETGAARLNRKLLVSPSRILNTVCGLAQNTDHAYSVVACSDAVCRTNITSLISGRKYVFNVVAVNKAAGLQSAYSGILVEANWDDSVLKNLGETIKNVGIVIGTAVSVLIGSFFVLYAKYA